MTFDEFKSSIVQLQTPAALSPALAALWWDAKDDWDKAHAYLHRREGDLKNARYWYGRAGRPSASGALPEEWAVIARAVLDDN